GKYRPPDEVSAWLEKDPVPTYRARLLAAGVDEGTLARIDEAALAQVDRATEEAMASPAPDLSLVEKDVFADGGAQWRR
ncbi:MAG: hypothetical protein WBW84_15675, partial [Acidobacteriaceae bacterium]